MNAGCNTILYYNVAEKCKRPLEAAVKDKMARSTPLDGASEADAPVPAARRYPRAAIYMGPVTERLSRQARAGNRNVSGRIEAICRRFEYLRAVALRDAASRWTPEDWVLFVQALQQGAGQMEYEAWKHVLYFAHAVAGQFEAVYGVNPSDVATRLRDAGDAVNIAVVDSVERYWQMSEATGHAEKLRALGLADAAAVKKWDGSRKARQRALERYEAMVRGTETHTLGE